MEVIRAYDFRMAPRAHVLAYHVLDCVRRSAVPLGPTSEQSLESQALRLQCILLQIQRCTAILQCWLDGDVVNLRLA